MKTIFILIISITLTQCIRQTIYNNTILPANANVTITNATNTTTNTVLPFKDGDKITLESTAVARTFMSTDTNDCKGKKSGEKCGDLKAHYEIDASTTFIVRLGQDGTFCLAAEDFPNAFLYMNNADECQQNSWNCADGMFIYSAGTGCANDFAWRLVGVTDNDYDCLTFYGLQSVQNSQAYLRMQVDDCAAQIDNKNSNPRRCGNVQARYGGNNDILQRGDYETFIIHTR
jgi:hypothetical protein